eukprot:TRINITY_DN67286_c0_g1_i1.p1 TRINITY_DN67286_c0_g1~~TRINITY_DN67286_c0_g1_i1.p1  ORF type:complete len:293 (-),score=71.53 TRINITY_DN67286_c0_g1_i1:74-844(-)
MFRQRTLQEVRHALAVLQSQAGSSTVESSQVILEVLDRLFDYVVDGIVLEKTAIGKEVTKLSKHSDKSIAQRAKELSDEWKEHFRLRKQVQDGFMEKGSMKRKEAKDIEEGLFNSFCPLGLLDGEAKKNYQRHYKRLCTHLRTTGPGSLASRLSGGELQYLQIASLPDDVLLSDEQRQQQRSARDEGLQAAVLTAEQPNGSITEDYVCSKCGSSRCSRMEAQTGWHNDQQDMTIFVTCLDCGQRWKESDDHGLAGS